jgi:hypothetical protein
VKNRWVATLAIILVAGVAAWASYWHITELSLVLHQPPKIAYVIALAVDGLVTVGSLALLDGMKTGWVAISIGLIISVYANVMSGIQFGIWSAIWAGVPSVSLFIATFVLERWLAHRAHSPELEHAPVLAAYDMVVSTLEGHAALLEAREAVTVSENVLGASQRLLAAYKPIVIPPAPVPVPVTEDDNVCTPRRVQKRSTPKQSTPRKAVTPKPEHSDLLAALKAEFEHELEHGLRITVRAVKQRMHVATPKAQTYHAMLVAA